MKFWFDTEFIENGPTEPIKLISIGIVSEDGREYYAESAETNLRNANEWVWNNVIPHLKSDIVERPMRTMTRPIETYLASGCAKNHNQIASDIRMFVGTSPEFWAYYADYDWVVLCQLYGTMMDLPDTWPMYCRDLKQKMDDIEIDHETTMSHLVKQQVAQPENAHNALEDARWNQIVSEFIDAHLSGY